MSINLLADVRRMKELLNVPDAERKSQWAHDVCAASRAIHLSVWQFRPSCAYVKKTIVPLLRQAGNGLHAITQRGVLTLEERTKIGLYASNDELRTRNLEENYVQGRSSSFGFDREFAASSGKMAILGDGASGPSTKTRIKRGIRRPKGRADP